MSTKPNYFADLNSIEVSTEKKGKLTYTSWAEAWKRVKLAHPDATYEWHMNADGAPGIQAQGGWWASVTVTIAGIAHRVWLPAMDQSNRAMQNPDATAINKAYQRALAKACAMHGIGLYVYLGEDLPDVDGDTPRRTTPQADGEDPEELTPKRAWSRAVGVELRALRTQLDAMEITHEEAHQAFAIWLADQTPPTPQGAAWARSEAEKQFA